MPYTNNPRLTKYARSLRRNMTPEEKHLWYDFLKDFPVMVHRQKVIGNYIVDFCIDQPKLIIELDGSQHGEAKQMEADLLRDAYLRQLGYTVLRYYNRTINQHFRDVCDDIWQHSFPNKI